MTARWITHERQWYDARGVSTACWTTRTSGEGMKARGVSARLAGPHMSGEEIMEAHGDRTRHVGARTSGDGMMHVA
jgi:hypothetical protein